MVRNVKFNTTKLAQDLNVSEVVAKLLVNRGIYSLDIAKDFLNSSINNLAKLSSLIIELTNLASML